MRRRALRVAVALAATAGVVFAARFAFRAPVTPPGPGRVAALTAERDRLQEDLRRAVIAGGEPSLARAPVAGLMIGLPTSFTSSILDQAVTGLFGETTLTLENLRARRTGVVEAEVLFAKRTLGTYALDVRIERVRGILKPGRPTLAYGADEVGVELPVRLAEGEGSADLRFRWDSTGFAASLVCGDVDVTRRITFTVAPQDYEVRGSFGVSGAGDILELTPRFPELAMRIVAEPTEQAWSVVDAVIRDRPRGCEIALDKADVREKLAGMLGRGFDVKVPQSIFKPIRLPLGASRTVELPGLTLTLRVKPAGVLVADDRIWYGADVSVRSKKAR